jgi:hypothetical protein
MTGLLELGRCCTEALKVGLAPRGWQQDCQRQTKSVRSLPQSCHWLQSANPILPKLQDQPLLGSCLPKLVEESDRTSTDAVVSPARSQPQIEARSQSQKTVPDCPKPRRFPRRSAFVEPPASPEPEPQLQPQPKIPCSAKEPLQLPARASTNLLQCLVEKPTPKPKAEQFKPEAPRQRYTPPVLPAPRTRKPAQEACVDVARQKRWRQQLVERTEDCLRSKSRAFEPLALKEKSVMVEELPSKPKPVPDPWMVGKTKPQSVCNPWVSALGKPVPLDLLVNLSTPKSSGKVSPVVSQESAIRQQRSEPSPSISKSPAPMQKVEDVSSRSRPLSEFWQAPQSEKRLSQFGEQLKRAEPIDPPAIAPTLPKLVAPQTGESASPVTSPLIEQRSRQEAIPEADLDGLASQIKRILDEEARRYGINV